MRPRPPHRRELLQRLAYGIAAVPLLQACGDDGVVTPADASPTDAPPGTDWATGGTVAMTDKASYPDPFTTPAASCVLVASSTAGPCTTATDLAREDVSEGWTGLPVRLALKVVDTSCAPLVGAIVKIWHTNIEGSYSGETPSNGFCLLKPAYSSNDFFRGVQTTSAAGVVYFDTCFPGWYPGRAIHIHFQIKMGATSTRVSQVFFPEAITQQIFAAHPEYKPFGQPDTSLASDGVFGGIPAAQRDPLVLTVARMTDGAMLASKILTVA